MTFTLSVEALIDLEDIWFYTAEKWSTSQADRYVNQILDEIEYISSNPENGIDYSHVRKKYFRTKVQSHFIYYKKETKKNNLEVVRVLHEMMDLDYHLD